VGLEVAPGRNRKIVWDAKELGEGYDGNVALEVRGRLYIPFVRIEKLQKVLKRGVAYQATWNGGTAQNILNFDLYRGEEKVTTFPNIANVGHTALIIPTHVKPGDDYRLQITDSRNRDQIVFTDVFRIKRRVPLGLKLGVVGILGGAGYYFASQSTGPSDIPEPGTPKK
ncbi:MAG: hypothetical protein K1X47_11275, partial [Cyclobacteriaceae bacterium]|nr:hypothetical protein [Cyclobacteriaceae bacterium]